MTRCSGGEPSRAHFPLARALVRPPPPLRSRRPWVEHWLDTCRDLQALKASHPMMDAVIDEIDGRMIRIGDQWLADFASCNYLGFDLDREIIEAIPAYLDTWGTHPSWSRLLGSPVIYEEIETRLTELLGSEDSLVLPTITHIHMSVIPLLAASGTIFLDARAHKTIYDGCQVARARGAAVKRFRFEDPDHLDQLLAAERDPTRLVCMDGVNSMTGNAPDIRAFAAVARKHGALLYVDDAHGFGVIGERRAGRVLRLRRARQQRGPPLRRDLRRHRARRRVLQGLLVAARLHRLPDRGQGPAQGGGPALPLLGTVARRLARQRAGRLRRQRAPRRRAAPGAARAHRARARLPGPARRPHPEPLGLPDRRDPAARPRRIDAVGRLLFERGVYVTLAAYPLVPRDEVGFRVQLTAANTDAEIDMLIGALEELAAGRRAADRRGRRLRRDRRRRPDMAIWARIRALPLWQVYLAAGALLCALYVWVPPFAGSGPVFNLLGLSPLIAIIIGLRRYRPLGRAVALVRDRVPAVLAGRPLHLQLSACARRGGAVPVAGRCGVRARLPRADGRAC